MSAAVVAFYVVRGLLLTILAWTQESVVQRTASDVASRLFRAYLAAPYEFHLQRNSAKLIQAVGQSVDAVLASGLGAAVNLATEALTLLALVTLLALAAPLATLVAVLAISVVLLFPLFVTRRLAPRLGAEIKTVSGPLHPDLVQSLASFK